MIFKAVVFVVFLLMVKRVWKMSNSFGFDRRGYIFRPGMCKHVQPIDTGSEDIDLANNGLAFISSGVSFNLCGDQIDERVQEFAGRIYLFDFNRPEKDAVEVTLPKEIRGDFNPHGVSLWQDPDSGDIRIFVVNHRTDGDVVEVLLFNNEAVSFSLIKSVRSDLFASLNDIVAVGPESFYAVNDGYFIGCWRLVEVIFGLSISRLVYYDGGMATTILKGEQDLNSVAISRDERQLYLTRPFNKRVDIYNISKDDTSLEFARSIHIGVGVDNVFVDRVTGDLWFGGHPSFHLLGDHMANLDVRAPSQVIRIHPSGPETDPFASYKMYSPFGDDGDLISGSSSAVHYQDKILIGSIHDKTVYCEINHGQK